MENIHTGADSWFYPAASGYNQFWSLEGWSNLNWKNNGFETIFDFITVTIFVERKIKHAHCYVAL
jgi:hypothetical protein